MMSKLQVTILYSDYKAPEIGGYKDKGTLTNKNLRDLGLNGSGRQRHENWQDKQKMRYGN